MLHGAALQLVGEALCGGAPALRLHLQQRQGPRGEGGAQPVHGPGGVQRGPAGHAQGEAWTTQLSPSASGYSSFQTISYKSLSLWH